MPRRKTDRFKKPRRFTPKSRRAGFTTLPDYASRLPKGGEVGSLFRIPRA